MGTESKQTSNVIESREPVVVVCLGCGKTEATVRLRSGGHLPPIGWYVIHGKDYCTKCGPEIIRKMADAMKQEWSEKSIPPSP